MKLHSRNQFFTDLKYNNLSNIAIIGANGFLGAALAEEVIKLNHNLICVYNKSSENIPKELFKIQITEFLSSAFPVDILYIVAGNYNISHNDLISVNCNLLQSLKSKYPTAKFIYISSTNVYGNHSEVINENSSFNSPNIYGLSKIVGEFIISSVQKYIIIRFTYLYGKKLTNLSFLPTIISKAKIEKKIKLKGDGSRVQDYLHISDAVDLCIKSIDINDNSVLLGASGVSISNLSVSKIIQKVIPECTIEFEQKELSASMHFDVKWTISKSNWSPKNNFEDLFKEMIY